MAQFEKCVLKVAKHMKGKVSEAEARKIVEAIEDKVFQKAAQQGSLVSDIVQAEALELAEGMMRQFKLEKRTALINLKAKKIRRGRIDSMVAEGLTLDKAIQAVTVGVAGNIEGGRLSVAARQRTTASRYRGGMIADMRKADVHDVFISKKMDREIARELWELSSEKPEVGVTGSKEAATVAKIVHKYQKMSVQRLNDAGADIGSLQGYITKQTHNRTRMRKMGRDKWIEEILPRLDVEKTFKGSDPRVFLSEAYDTLITGEALEKVKPESDRLIGYKGMGNVAKRVSQSRSLHFKSADDWMDYHDTLGLKDLSGSIVESLERAANNTELMKAYGVNPRAAFDADMQHYRQKARGDEKKLARIDGIRKQLLDYQFKEIDGSTRIVESHSVANIFGGIRAVNNMTKLGAMVLSAFADIPLKASELKFQGKSYLEGYKNGLVSIFKGRGPEERQRIANLLGVGFDGMIGATVSRYGAVDGVPGMLATTQAHFFKFNLGNWWNDSQKIGVSMIMSHDMALNVKKPYASLNDDMKRVLKFYEIGEKEWPVLKEAATEVYEGKKFLTPDSLEYVDDALVLKYLNQTDASPRQIRAAKEELQTKLQTFYTDRVDIATLTPGAREHAIMKLGTESGTPMGEAIRSIMQFKSFPISVLTKVVGRNLYGKGHADVPAMVHMAVMTTIFGYMSMSAKDMAKGLEPRPVDKEETWAAAMLQGGGAGILGDFLLGDYNRYGGGGLETVLGPTVGAASEFLRIYGKAMDGDDVAAKSLNFLINNAVPGSNLFYARTVLNYLFIYQMQEAMNPGYLRRMERRKKKDQGQEFILPPSTL